jgi:hypothetical protein
MDAIGAVLRPTALADPAQYEAQDVVEDSDAGILDRVVIPPVENPD